MATTAAAEAAGANKSRPGLDPPPQTAVAPTRRTRGSGARGGVRARARDGGEEYVPEDVPKRARRRTSNVLAAGARDPEVLSQALAALPADQRETFEAQLKAAGVM